MKNPKATHLATPLEFSSEVRTITPEIAEVMLQLPAPFTYGYEHRVDQDVVDKLVAAMKHGDFQCAAPIAFDVNNCLHDGRHRLLACVQGDVAFKTVVVFGLEPITWTNGDNTHWVHTRTSKKAQKSKQAQAAQ